MDLHILNRGETPTFDTVRGGQRYTSFIDVTMCTTDILDVVDNWRVDEGLTSSDHNGMTLNIYFRKPKHLEVKRTTRVYNTRKANCSQFHAKLTQLKI